MAGEKSDKPQTDLAFLGQSLDSLTSGSPSREAYLARLAELVRTGRYEVNALDLARKLMEDAERNES